MQFIAECGIENGLQIVTPFFSQAPRLPLYKEKQEIFPKLQKKMSLNVPQDVPQDVTQGFN
jgi:hypothetical protein